MSAEALAGTVAKLRLQTSARVIAVLQNACEISPKSPGAGTQRVWGAARGMAGRRRAEAIAHPGGDEEGQRVEELKLVWDFLVCSTGRQPGALKPSLGCPGLRSLPSC